MSQETQTGVLYSPIGVGWGGRWEGGSKGETITMVIHPSEVLPLEAS